MAKEQRLARTEQGWSSPSLVNHAVIYIHKRMPIRASPMSALGIGSPSTDAEGSCRLTRRLLDRQRAVWRLAGHACERAWNSIHTTTGLSAECIPRTNLSPRIFCVGKALDPPVAPERGRGEARNFCIGKSNECLGIIASA
jgi:hypothetical protein